jgi:hypothetical protein
MQDPFMDKYKTCLNIDDLSVDFAILPFCWFIHLIICPKFVTNISSKIEGALIIIFTIIS